MSTEPVGRVWIDGAIVDVAAARVPVIDHGLLYGDGIFEACGSTAVACPARAPPGRLQAARARCRSSCRAAPSLRKIVFETARDYGRDEAYVRLT